MLTPRSTQVEGKTNTNVHVLLLDRDDHARTAMEMVLALRGHKIELCSTHESMVEKLRAGAFDFVLYGIETDAPDLNARLTEIQSLSRSTTTMLIGVVDEHNVASLDSEVMERIDQLLVRPLDLEMLDHQFETFEQAARSRKHHHFRSTIQQVPVQALATLADRGHEIGFLVDGEARVHFSTDGIESITGRDAYSYYGQSFLDLIHPDDRATASNVLESRVEKDQVDIRVLDANGQPIMFDIQFIKFPSGRGTGSYVLAGRQKSVTVEPQNTSDTKLSDHGNDLILHIDRSGNIHRQTASFAALLGSSEDQTPSRLNDYLFEADRQFFDSAIESLPAASGGQRKCLVRVRTANDRWRSLELTCTNLIGVEGIDAIVVNADDVTTQKSLEHHLMRRAFLDPLTGMPNRVYFLSRLERALSRIVEDSSSLAVLFLDLDRFKLINDSLGHEVGDRLLIAVGQRLKTAVRPGDIVARFGGDELIVLLEDVNDPNEAITVANRIIDGIRDPLVVGNHEISISTSIGIAMSEPDLLDANLLIRNADIALYRAKELGSSRYTMFDETMAQRVRDRLDIENNLRRALDNDQLTIEFLPELNLADGNLTALEVLTRWQDTDGVAMDPSTFMQVAEETGLILRLGRWAFVEACEHVRRWRLRHQSAENIMIAVNMSVREFQQPDLVEFISSTLREHDIPPANLRIEIDERSLAADPDDTLAKVKILRELGVCFAIDNFGRGFSSLSIFTRFAFDMLKVDRQFVSGNDRMVSNLSIVRAVTSLAHALGMKVSAEGIETREHLQRVQAAGCDYGQGFLFSKSLDATATEALFLSSSISEAA